MNELLIKEAEIIQSLTWMLNRLLKLLKQYTDIEEYESQINLTLIGDDLIFKD